MTLKTTAIVLAGGKSRRLGRDKVVEPFDGQPLIQRVLCRLTKVTEEAVVVVNDASRACELPLPHTVRTAVDLFPNGGSLGGIFTGLNAAKTQWAFAVACDMPFLNIPLMEHILSMREGSDVVVPVVKDRPEPTHAAYSKTCLPHMERRLQADDLKISGFFNEVRVRYIEQTDIERFDLDHLSFFNVNTEGDLNYALQLVSKGH